MAIFLQRRRESLCWRHVANPPVLRSGDLPLPCFAARHEGQSNREPRQTAGGVRCGIRIRRSGFEPNDDRLCASAVGRAQRHLRRARDTAAGDRHGKRNARATSGDGDRRWKYQRVALGPNGLQRNDRIRPCDRAERYGPRRGFIAVEDHCAGSRWSDDGQRLQHGSRRARRSASARCGKNTRRNRRSAEKVRCSQQHQPRVACQPKLPQRAPLPNRSSRPVNAAARLRQGAPGVNAS
jgi:hypothetical protein